MQTFSFYKSRYAVLAALFLIFGIFIVINTALLQFESVIGGRESDSPRWVFQERGHYRAARDIFDRNGIPIAVSININVLYLCNANLPNDQFNRMALDLAKFLESEQCFLCKYPGGLPYGQPD